jgi:hypothetical protein
MGTVPNSNRKIAARDKLDTAIIRTHGRSLSPITRTHGRSLSPITRTHGRSLSPITRTHGRSFSWLGTGSSTKMMAKLN